MARPWWVGGWGSKAKSNACEVKIIHKSCRFRPVTEEPISYLKLGSRRREAGGDAPPPLVFLRSTFRDLLIDFLTPFPLGPFVPLKKEKSIFYLVYEIFFGKR